MRLLSAFLFFLLFSVAPFGSRAQVVMRFDSLGKLNDAPRSIIRSNQKVALRLPYDTTLVNLQDSVVRKRFNYLTRVLNDSVSDERIQLDRQIHLLYHFFNSELDRKASDCAGWSAYLKEKCMNADSIDAKLKDADFIKLIGISSTDYNKIPVNSNCGVECNCILGKQKMNELRAAEKALTDYVEREKLILDLLCNEKQSNPFLLDNSRFRENKIILPTNSLYPPNLYIGNWFFDGKDAFEVKQRDGKKVFEKEIQANKKSNYLNFSIHYTDLISKTIFEWHNEQQTLLNKESLGSLEDIVKKDAIILEPYSKKFLNCDPCVLDSLKYMESILRKYDTVWCPGHPIGKWLMNWLWYSGGDFRLNYLPFTSPENLASKDTVALENETLAKVEELKQRVDAIKKCLGCSVKSLDTLRSLQDSLASYKAIVAAINQKREKRVTNDMLIKKFSTYDYAFHSARIPAFNSDDKRIVLYHDVSNNLERWITKKAVFPDDRIVFYGFYNSKENDTAGVLAIKEELTKFNDTGVFLQNLISAGAGLEGALSLANPYAGAINVFLSNLSGKGFGVNKVAAHESIGKDTITCKKFQDKIKTDMWRFQLLKKMLADYASTPTPGKLKSRTDDSTGYFTYTVKAKGGEAPYTNTYSLTYKQKFTSTEKYSVGRQKLLAFGGGFFYNVNPAPQVKVDTAGNNFNITTTDTRTKFVLGVKVFPWKLFEPDGGLIPKYPLKRISLFLGFEVQKPLDNLYAGLGWDIVPGLQISAGAHIYKRDDYTIQNNTIVSKSSNYKSSGLYFGATLDPVALSGLIKSFFH